MTEPDHFPNYQLEQVPVDAMKIPDWDIRGTRPEDDVQDIASSMKEEGQLVPVILAPKSEDTYEIIDGVHRYLAANKLMWDSLNALILSEDRDNFTIGVISNIGRVQVSREDKIRLYRYLLEEQELATTDVADRLGVSPRTARNYRAILELDEQIIEWVSEGHIPIEAAAKLSGLPSPEEQFKKARKWKERPYSQETMLVQVKNAKERLQEQEQEDQDSQEDERDLSLDLNQATDSKGNSQTLNQSGGANLNLQQKQGSTSQDQDQEQTQETAKPDLPTCYACQTEFRPELMVMLHFSPQLKQKIQAENFQLCHNCGLELVDKIASIQNQEPETEQKGGEN